VALDDLAEKFSLTPGRQPRTGEGRAHAKANGVRLGRKPKLTDHQKREAIKRRDHGEESLAEIGRTYNVSRWTISRLQL
jgi:DNA invertase Pin-like site-specific DNA recombinase